MAIRKGIRSSRRRTGWNVVGIVVCVIWVFPLYWMLNTSFKTTSNLLSPVPSFLPVPFTFGNFVDAVTRSGFWLSMGNSLMLALSVTLLSIVLGFLAAAALSRYWFRGRSVVLVVVIAVQMLPPTAMLVPLFLSLKSLDLLDSYVGLGLAYLATGLPLSMWMLRGFFEGIPREVEEAAMIDGAGTTRILCSIHLPLIAPGLVATSVFGFINAWNDYIVAYVLLKSQSKYTFPVWLIGFSNRTVVDYGGLIAASVLFTIPAVIIFLIMQRNLVAGMSAGAVKG